MMEKDVVKSDLPFEVYDLSQNFKQIKMLIYGPDSSGRSVLAGSAAVVPEMGEVLGISFGNSMLSLASFGYDKKMTLTNVENYSTGKNNFVHIHNFIDNNPTRFDTIIIDSLTHLQELLIAEEVAKSGKAEPDLRVWSSVAASLRDFVRKLKDLPVHVIATVSEGEKRNEDTGAIMVRPAMVGQMATSLPGYFDIVGRMKKVVKDGKENRVIVFSGDKFTVKDNTGALGKYLPNPEFKHIYKLIDEKHNLGASNGN